MARNGIMRRSNLRRIATRIEKIADELATGGSPEDVMALRREVANIRREADANAPRRAQETPQRRADTVSWI